MDLLVAKLYHSSGVYGSSTKDSPTIQGRASKLWEAAQVVLLTFTVSPRDVF